MANPSLFFRWHHRVLGTLWGLFGLFLIGASLRNGSLVENGQWIVLLLATAFGVAGTGFVLGRIWARRTIGVLMVGAVLWFLDMMLLASCVGNHGLSLLMKFAVGAAAYTWWFLAIPLTEALS